MPYAAALSTIHDTTRASLEACDQALNALEATPDLAFLFVSHHHADRAEELAKQVRERLGARCLIGCTGDSIVGNDQEVEHRPALSLWLAHWKQPVELTSFHLELEQTRDGYTLLGWPDAMMEIDASQASLLLLGEPFTFPVDAFLDQVNEGSPNLRVLGGMASGAQGPGENRLIRDGTVHAQGAVGVLVQGPVKVRSIVSQGCRPIGRPLVITKAKENIIHELGGQAPLQRLQELWHELNPRDQQLFQQGLHIGRVIDEYREEFRRGDFLVRNVLGLHRESGALIITDQVRVGQTVQFHIRDADTAAEDLHAMLQFDLSAHPGKPAGALLFTCNGRGTRLFSQPNHDAQAIRSEAGPIPLAGFFAQGELGPIGGQNFIHGFTASVALFEE